MTKKQQCKTHEDPHGITFTQPSMTRQSELDSANINSIISRFDRTGELPSNVRRGSYGDFTHVSCYTDAMQMIVDAREKFMDLPAELREYFDNDPAKLIEAMEDPQRVEELVEVGIYTQEAVPSPNKDVSDAGTPPTPVGESEPSP